MAIPILNRNTKGIIHESINNIIATHANNTAIPTYIGSSCSHNAFKSVTKADIPVTRHCFPVTFLNSCIAFIVSSAEVDVSKNTAIKVESSLLNTSLNLSGSISIGTLTSNKLSYQITLSTCSIDSILSVNSET